MVFNLSNPYEHQGFKDYVNKLYAAKVVVEVKKINPKRSLAQNSYLHVILGYFASQYGCSLDEAKIDYFKRLCNKDMFEETVTNKAGKEVKRLRSSSDLTTAEMTLAIERFRNWSAAEGGIYLPSPNEGDMIIYARQEVERNQQFL